MTAAADTTFLWHDYETFGADPRRDRPCQFAAIRTDSEFNEIGDPQMFYCQPADDYLPHPQALLVTGITPQQAKRDGLPEAEFAARIQALMAQPNTCTLGYNSLRFDDEVSRHLFYRNFFDPYAREWQNGNSRWDLIDLVRTFYALRPEGIVWPKKEDGSPSFKLEDLTQANGITEGSAHDALVDVRATIALARLLKQKQPRLFEHLFKLKSKHQVAPLLQLDQPKPLLHISSRYPASRGCAAIVLPLAAHPTNPNGVLVYDLSVTPQPLFDLTVEQIHERVFTSASELAARGLERLPLKVVHTNRCPVLLPAKAMEPHLAERLGLNLEDNAVHWQQLQAAAGLDKKVQAVFEQASRHFPVSQDPDLRLYSGPFFSKQDQAACAQVRAASAEALAEQQNWVFQDERLDEMLFRYRARNYPDTLTTAERERWDEYRWQKMRSSQLSSLTLEGLQQELIKLSQQPLTEDQVFLLQELQLYVESILPLQFMDELA